MYPPSEDTVLCLNGKEVRVDSKIAPLIQTLNETGYKTRWCCCGHILNGRPKISYYIAFEANNKNVRLVNRLGKYLTDYYGRLKPESREHIVYYRPRLFCDRVINGKKVDKMLCVYFQWKTPDDIDWINKIVESML